MSTVVNESRRKVAATRHRGGVTSLVSFGSRQALTKRGPYAALTSVSLLPAKKEGEEEGIEEKKKNFGIP